MCGSSGPPGDSCDTRVAALLLSLADLEAVLRLVSFETIQKPFFFLIFSRVLVGASGGHFRLCGVLCRPSCSHVGVQLGVILGSDGPCVGDVSAILTQVWAS